MTVLTPELKTEVARALLNAGAVGFSLTRPIVFKSGIRSPVYVDNRRLPFYPDCWKPVIRAFSEYARALSPLPDVIAGVAVGGVPHSATVGYITGIPSVFVRKESKGYGKDQLVEGGDVRGLRVLLTEDLITTGGSSLGAVAALRAAGAVVPDAVAIVSYGFPEAADAFANAGVRFSALTDFSTILSCAIDSGKISQTDAETVQSWLTNPYSL